VPLALVASLVAFAMSTPARADEAVERRSSQRYSVRAELGGEIDTNANRTEIVSIPGGVNAPAFVNQSPVVSPVARAVVGGTISDVLGDNHQVALAATFATKIFTNPGARGEDVAVVDASALWRKTFAQRWGLALTGGYYDAFQRDVPAADNVSDRRDFRSMTPTLRLSRALGDHVEAGIGGGYRNFVFKPDHSYDFQAPTGVLDVRWARETADGAADWDVTLRSGYEHRLFAGRQFIENTSCNTAPMCLLPITGPEERRDHFLTSGLDVTRTGRFLMGAGYGLHVNLSNSFGGSVLRQIVTLRFAAALPFELYLAARVEVLFARYADQVYVAPAMDVAKPWVTIEDENRNSARVELSRNLSDHLQLIARYTFYANELSRNNDVSYRRQVALLTLSYSLEN
jgi:hypothetical protein